VYSVTHWSHHDLPEEIAIQMNVSFVAGAAGDKKQSKKVRLD
jgi:hypothetical protein